ncbi:LAFA_0F10660g1_1 [Lachancea sp. 'fantastica']|nr:LAFA_0F10660g1_1 [Lachancea sp. 'fantastica']
MDRSLSRDQDQDIVKNSSISPHDMFVRISRKSPAVRELRLSKLFSHRRFSSHRAAKISFWEGTRSSFAIKTVGLGLGLIGAGLSQWEQPLSVGNDVGLLEDNRESVMVDKSVAPFLTELGPPDFPLTTAYTLLGFGTRSVTFVNFKVYALGLYVAKQDLSLISQILSTNYLSQAFVDTDASKSHSENIELALRDPVKSRTLIGNLIDGGVRMTAKITPIRNTDFNHLKEGLVKSILNHPDAKSNQEVVSRGIQQLKDAFIRKGSVPKNDDLLVELQVNGSLQLSYRSRKSEEQVMLGRVDEPLIGRLLFSQYLSGPKPLSSTARDSFVAKVKTLV